MAIENANPTIINVDELPTRRGKPSHLLPKEEGPSILSLLTPTPNPALQIYLDGEEPISDEEDELAEEPIDEQEIYGSSYSPVATRSLMTSASSQPQRYSKVIPTNTPQT
jgi:hypothetical protein